MFCIYNTFTLPALSKPTLPSVPAQNLTLYIGIALSKSISVFKQRKINEQLQPSISQKSSSSTKITQNEEKLQKNGIEVQATLSEEKKSAQQLKELQTKKTEEAIQTPELDRKKQCFVTKRRLIRKTKSTKCKQEIKKVEKGIKVSIVQKNEFSSFTAHVPRIRILSAKEKLAKIEELLKRQVKQWKIIDPTTERRKRFLKHLQ